MQDFAEIRAIRSTRCGSARLLTAWSVGSIIIGVAIYMLSGQQELASRKFGEALAVQFVIWGAIDLFFALAGVAQARRADATPLDAPAAERDRRECDQLIKTLRFNAKLNWLWISTGFVLAAAGVGAIWRGADSEAVGSLLGHGAGVIIQGGFLFWFDRRFLAALQSIRTSAVAA